ncbi:sensor histidine kinase [Sphingobacterium spiritivorum]|uniref:Histidine kinase n=1 Tax=Sphingobacterium spiritivorum ATCC 33861 TaxID=525373 RepID=D7VPH3_SPHSI|nr:MULTISPECIES: histidine kinase [Sphingobacterium]EFK57820.1 histidine kinase [Sphingobacterium spiritivorum ATCC 33861]QQT26520.1 histidine kinase [Sphingobacterium spiritivorum]QQT36152.1 histidine kinase [Sphingobacterium spiritivorum]WQD32888.1 histidine kinase [Sphingobacterium spiritivorum]SUJ16186.1 Probable sensor-like histidine kinase YehU [Sphingobacterium spiritivorum]
MLFFKLPANKNYLIHVSAWTICILYFLVVFGLLIWSGTTKEIALYDAGINALSITLCCYILSSTINFFLPRKGQMLRLSAIGLIVVALGLYVSRIILLQIFSLIDISYFDFSIPYRVILNFLVLFCIAILQIVWNIQEEYEENKKRKEESEKMVRDAELYNLRQQLQPHFLFNSLNSIIALIGIKPEKAREMTFQLSDFLRGTMRKDNLSLISLKDELSHLQLYLDIEKVRFGHRLNTEVHFPEELSETKLPTMIIQPLLENAIKFGLYNITGDVLIKVEVSYADNLLWIRITNPIENDQYENTKGTGFGLSSVQRRLFLIFGRTDLLFTETKDKSFISTLKIPQYD